LGFLKSGIFFLINLGLTTSFLGLLSFTLIDFLITLGFLTDIFGLLTSFFGLLSFNLIDFLTAFPTALAPFLTAFATFLAFDLTDLTADFAVFLIQDH
jgi:hypothetical protein